VRAQAVEREERIGEVARVVVETRALPHDAPRLDPTDDGVAVDLGKARVRGCVIERVAVRAQTPLLGAAGMLRREGDLALVDHTPDARSVQQSADRDILVIAKVIGAEAFPVERPAIIGADRETGALLRLTPFPWKGADTDPPLPKWAWVHATTRPSPYDPRPETREPEGEIVTTAYVDAKDGWRLRWPFVRPHVRRSLEEVQQLAREGSATVAFVRPAPDIDVLQLPLRLRFRCDDAACTTAHELPILDWELHEMARLSRERFGPKWATEFRQRWGAPLAERSDLHILVSMYAQAATRPYVAGLFYPPRSAEDAHAHAHHVGHRSHSGGPGASS